MLSVHCPAVTLPGHAKPQAGKAETAPSTSAPAGPSARSAPEADASGLSHDERGHLDAATADATSKS